MFEFFHVEVSTRSSKQDRFTNFSELARAKLVRTRAENLAMEGPPTHPNAAI